LNIFILTAKQWIEKTNAIGLISKSGRYGAARHSLDQAEPSCHSADAATYGKFPNQKTGKQDSPKIKIIHYCMVLETKAAKVRLK